MLVNSRENVGKMLVKCWQKVRKKLGKFRENKMFAKCWPKVRKKLGKFRENKMFAKYWPKVRKKLGKGGGYKLVWWQQLFIYYLLRWRVQCTHYTPVAEEQTYSVI